ncbi:MAG: 16S rRNA processing protein RimM [Chloroflexi bacterium]|nr:16S rRNA processing protein RimM [Chloroflexota bacterium]
MPDPALLTVGRVLRPHGVRGELVLEVLTDFPDSLLGKTIYAAETAGERGSAHEVVSLRRHHDRRLIRLAGCVDREAAETYRGLLIQIDATEAVPLAEGQYYHHQIVGLRAISDEGEALGIVAEVLETGANDVYVVETPAGGELLLPAISTVVKKIDVPAGEITVHLIEGLR